MFQKDGVGAGPAAPEPTEQGGEEEEGEAHSGDAKEEDPEILGGESDTEEVELTGGEIEEDRGSVVDLNPGQCDIDDQEKKGENPSSDHEATGDIGRVQNVVGSVIVDGGDTVEIRILVGIHGGNMRL